MDIRKATVGQIAEFMGKFTTDEEAKFRNMHIFADARLRGIVLATAVLCAVPATGYGQDQCSELLRRGIYDYYAEQGASSSASASKKELCRAYEEYKSDTASGRVAATYKIFSGEASVSKESIRSIGESMCDLQSSSFNAQDFSQRNSATISPAAIQAWQACVTQAAMGIAVETSYVDTDQGVTSITVALHRSGSGTGVERITGISTSNLRCISGTLLPIAREDNPSPIPLDATNRSLTCERSISSVPFHAGSRVVYADNARLTIETTLATIERSLPAVLPRRVDLVPRGTIVAWYSSSGPVPAGWALCDGSSGTPDLRDRFLMGVGQFTAVGSTGGSNHINVSVPIGPLYLSTGGTDHNYALRGDPACNGCGITNHRAGVNYLVNSFTKDSEASAKFDNRPGYVGVAYIMKL